MNNNASSQKPRRLKRLLLYCAGLFGIYVLMVVTVFRTPKASYWIDHPDFHETKYFHFLSGKDAWMQRLTNTPPPETRSYRLAMVELDEFGDFFQSEKHPDRPEDYQLSCAKEMLIDAAFEDDKPVLLFLFVHGWRNDASPEDETLGAFKQLLGHIAASDWASNFATCGVYIGWRGASIQKRGFTLPLELISFWGRKSVASKISSTRTSAAIFGLIDIAHKAVPANAKTPSRIVLAGHSLGAGILMNSVSQALAYDFANATSRKRPTGQSVALESPVNLILLLNPAIESVYLRQLRECMLPENNPYPWLVSLTSETDWITKRIFPLAQLIEVSGARTAPYLEVDWRQYGTDGGTNEATESRPRPSLVPQSVYVARTPGHNEFMRDMHLVVRTNTATLLAKIKSVKEGTNIIAYNSQYGSHKYFLLRRENEQDPLWGFFDNMRPTKAIHPLFWVATVDKRIMNGHGLPFTDKVRRDNFVGTLMAIMADSTVRYPELSTQAEIAPETVRQPFSKAPPKAL